MTEQEILKMIDADGYVTWWPGGPSHNVICELRDRGIIELVDASESQETKFLVRRMQR